MFANTGRKEAVFTKWQKLLNEIISKMKG